jgi:signal transduction histidine kinase
MAGAVAVVAVILVTTILSHRFVRPIYQLGDQAAAIAKGDFKTADVPNRNDEIRDLTLSINQMAQQLGLYENEVRRNEQLRTLGKLGAGMAHQLRNAATGGLMAIELHKRRCTADAHGESLDVALRQLHLMESYLQRFLLLGQSRPIPFEKVSLTAVVEDALELVRPACAHAGIELNYIKPGAPIMINGDPDALRQLTVNLVLNASEAAAGQQNPPGKIGVDLELLKNDRAALHIRDSGPGPAQDVAQRLFEPFVSGKPEGTGLGLFVAHQVAQSHHGSISWKRENNMTCFTVEFPLMQTDNNHVASVDR